MNNNFKSMLIIHVNDNDDDFNNDNQDEFNDSSTNLLNI